METTTVDGSAVYLYGFVRPPVTPLSLRGVCGTRVFLVERGALACAASVVDRRDVTVPDDVTAAEQVAWLAPRASQHHEVLRRLHEGSGAVPLKFGTLCDEPRDVQRLLGRLHHALDDLLRQLTGKDEWTLRLSLDLSAMRQSVDALEPDLVALKEQEAQLPEGRAYFARKRLERARADAVARRIDALEDAVYEQLTQLGVAIAPSERAGNTTSGAACVVSAPILVDRRRSHDLAAVLAELEEEHATWGLSFELVGPWPPYSFTSTIDVASPQVN